MDKISHSFLTHASDILADTAKGLSGTQLVKFFVSKSVDYGVEIPHSKAPLTDVPNKRAAFLENLERFSPNQQFEIINELAEHKDFIENEDAIKLRQKLHSQYSLFGNSGIAESDLVKQTEHWLQQYPDPYKLYMSGIEKYKAKIYERNLLDDFRLSLELLLKSILGNNKSLENQIADLATFQKARGMSTEVTNMFNKLVDYYSKYQNTYVKHNDNVNHKEIDFVIDLTSSFMKYLIAK